MKGLTLTLSLTASKYPALHHGIYMTFLFPSYKILYLLPAPSILYWITIYLIEQPNVLSFSSLRQSNILCCIKSPIKHLVTTCQVYAALLPSRVGRHSSPHPYDSFLGHHVCPSSSVTRLWQSVKSKLFSLCNYIYISFNLILYNIHVSLQIFCIGCNLRLK